jgi:hypothetical protein
VAGPLTPEFNDRLNLTAVPADLTLWGQLRLVRRHLQATMTQSAGNLTITLGLDLDV